MHQCVFVALKVAKKFADVSLKTAESIQNPGACCDWARFWAHGKWVGLVAKLVWRVELVAEVCPGVVTETKVACIKRDEEAGLADLGLRLGETKQLVATLQAQIVPAQVAAVGECCRSCVTCERLLASKGHYPVTFRSLFGDVPIRVRRLLACPCKGLGERKSFAAMDFGNDAVAPELAYVTARYAALVPFGKVAGLLSELLPISGAQNAGTVRNRRGEWVRTSCANTPSKRRSRLRRSQPAPSWLGLMAATCAAVIARTSAISK